VHQSGRTEAFIMSTGEIEMKRILLISVAGLFLAGAATARPVPSGIAVLPHTFTAQAEVSWLPWWVLNGARCMVSPGPLCVRK
jgi:hypothetical protein